MRTGRVLVMLTAVGVLAGAGWVSSQHRGGQPELTGADIAEIQQLYFRYSQGRDWDDEELFLTAWADDAVFTEGNGVAHAGIEGIRAQFREESASGINKRITHDNPNILIWRDAEGVVHGRGYWNVIDVTQTPPQLMLTGHYFDTFSKTPDGWRIQTRGSKRGWDWRTDAAR